MGDETTPRRSGRKRHRPSDLFNPSDYQTLTPSSSKKRQTKVKVTSESPSADSIKNSSTKKKRTPSVPRSSSRSPGKRKKSDSFGRLLPDVDASSRSTGSLFGVVTDAKAALKPSILSWKRRYLAKPNEGMHEVLTFILNCCGYESEVTLEMLKKDQKKVVKKLQSECLDSTAAYPLVSRAASMKKFPDRLDLAVDLMIKSVENLIFESDQDSDNPGSSLVTFLTEWCTALSRCNSRAFRHTSTHIAFALLNSLLDLSNNERSQISARSRQLQNEIGKGSNKGKSKAAKGKANRTSNVAKVAQLKRDLEELQGHMAKADTYISTIFENVFVSRYRDVWSHIRQMCLENLGKWILRSPSFTADSYLKYVGWSLYSHETSIRLMAVSIVQQLVASDTVRPSMEAFLERFVPRIIEMHNDIDGAVAGAAIDCCTCLLTLEDVLPDRGEFGEVAPLLWDRNVRVRRAAAQHIFEDSFVVEHEDGVDRKVAMLEDLDQLLNIYQECGPVLEGETGDQNAVSYLVDDFFFKLQCLRDWSLLNDALMEGEDSANQKSPEELKSRQSFFARCMLASAQVVNGELTIDSPCSKKLPKASQLIVESVRESLFEFVKGSSFSLLVVTFQSDDVVLSRLCRIICLCEGVESTVISVLVSAFGKVVGQDALTAVAAALNHIGAHQQIHDIAVALQKDLGELPQARVDSDVGVLQNSTSTRLRAIVSQTFVQELVESNTLDHALSLECRVVDFSNRDSSVSLDQSQVIANLLAIGVFNAMWLVRCLMGVDSEPCDDPDGLRNVLEVRLIALSQALEALLVDRSPLHEEACEAVGTLTTLSVGFSDCRHALSTSIYERLYEVGSQSLSDVWKDHNDAGKNMNLAKQRNILGVCSSVAVTPGQHKVASLVLAFAAAVTQDDDSLEKTVALEACKAVMSFYRSRQWLRPLAQAQLHSLQLVFELVIESDDRDKGLACLKDMAKRLSLSYGTSSQHCFADLMCSGIDYALSKPEFAQFADVALPFFAHRSSATEVDKTLPHLAQVLRSSASKRKGESIADLSKLSQALKKRKKVVARQRLESVQEEALEDVNSEQILEENGDPVEMFEEAEDEEEEVEDKKSEHTDAEEDMEEDVEEDMEEQEDDSVGH